MHTDNIGLWIELIGILTLGPFVGGTFLGLYLGWRAWAPQDEKEESSCTS